MTSLEERDEMLNEILKAMGADLKTYQSRPQYQFIVDDLRAAARKLYAAGYNDCAESFHLEVRIVSE